jgi:hypothetical protein
MKATNKQTAVEWLVDQLNEIGFHTILIEKTIDQAKEMELEQIEFFFKQGHLHSGCPYGLEETYKKTFENESND